ncbi:hypothetical protein YZ82_01380 [Campylobacter hyointestinalis]|uniref:Uncharacterized protein n=1 Tax=Campylobacter hyointestinalis TaxID=198 RepID=A0A562XKB8_CAMHY|nr:hypothetical protein [Campylobacter hyointestinalis]TWO22594.1 hypothetical protein YZ82_01380 [Campylobacter hyointestinalis]
MNKEMLGEKLKNRFKDLEALVEQELGVEQMEAIMKIIYLNDESDIGDIVYDDKFYYHCDEYDFKPFSKQDFIDAYLVLFKGDEREAKNEVLDAYIEGFIFDNEKELKDALSYIYFNEITAKKYLSKQMAKKYYKYFTLDFIKEFLAK